MQNEQQPTNEQSLQIIQQMIAVAQKKVSQNGFHFLLWGFLNVGAAMAQYFFLKLNCSELLINSPWILMGIIGGIAATIYERRKDKIEKHQTFTDHFYGWVWVSFGISMFVGIFYANVYQVNMIPIILTLAAFATMVSGAILQFTPLKIGAIVFWASALTTCFFSPTNGLLVFSLAIALGYILPGILLWKKFNQQERV